MLAVLCCVRWAQASMDAQVGDDVFGEGAFPLLAQPCWVQDREHCCCFDLRYDLMHCGTCLGWGLPGPGGGGGQGRVQQRVQWVQWVQGASAFFNLGFAPTYT